MSVLRVSHKNERVVGLAKIIAQAEQVNFFALAVGVSSGDKGEPIIALSKGRKNVWHIGKWRDGFYLEGIVRIECPFDDVGRNIALHTEHANRL